MLVVAHRDEQRLGLRHLGRRHVPRVCEEACGHVDDALDLLLQRLLVEALDDVLVGEREGAAKRSNPRAARSAGISTRVDARSRLSSAGR